MSKADFQLSVAYKVAMGAQEDTTSVLCLQDP